MIVKLFAVFDRKAQTYYGIQFLNTPAEAIRAFGSQVNKPSDQPLYQYPDDFELHMFGSWDATSGVFDLLPRPESIALGSNLKLPASSSSS